MEVPVSINTTPDSDMFQDVVMLSINHSIVPLALYIQLPGQSSWLPMTRCPTSEAQTCVQTHTIETIQEC